MKRYFVRYTLGLAIALVFLGDAARLHQIGFVSQLDAIIYDAKVRLTMPGTVDTRVVILDIDEKSLKEMGRWPWSRDRMALLVTKLFDRYGIALLGMDVVFPEPDHSSGLRSLEKLAETELRGDVSFESALQRLRPQLDYDRLFADALRGRSVILGYYLSTNAGGASSGTLPAPILREGFFGDRRVSITSWSSYGANLPEFQNAAAGAGHFNPLVDFDGVTRRVPLLAEFRGGYYESLSLAMVRHLLGKAELVPGFAQDKSASANTDSAIEWIDLRTPSGVLRIPVDEHAAALIPFRGSQGSFAYYSAADILKDRIDPDALRGRIAVLGTTAPGLLDLRATPVGATFPGVEVHASLIAGMLDGRVKERPQYVLGAGFLQLALGAVIMVFLVPLLSPARATLVSLAVLVLLFVINLGFWQYASLALPVAADLLMVFALFALNMSWGYFVESRARRQFATLFGQYVPPELVEEMSRDPKRYSMEGRNAELTVLFSDIRGFTSIAEGLEPRQLTQLMNEYLTTMTDVIRRHRGTLDKYIGDAIMAFWGAPVHDVDHAQHAVLAALEMQAALAELNPKLLSQGWPSLTIGIGINTGSVTVGDMGSTVRKAYTVMGDAVNLASRLEGITRRYDAAVIVGEATRGATKDIIYRELDRVRVKGKGESVTIFEPLGLEDSLDAAALEELRLWNLGLTYYRAQNWDQSEMTLLRLIRLAPQRGLYSLYLSRIGALRREPPTAGWDAVTSFETK